jgi:hypothetical protein
MLVLCEYIFLTSAACLVLNVDGSWCLAITIGCQFVQDQVISSHMWLKSVCITSWLISQEDKIHDDVLLRKGGPAFVN